MHNNENAPAVKQGAQSNNQSKDTNFVENTQLLNARFSELQEDINDNLDRIENEHEAGFFRVRGGNRRMADAQAQPIPQDLYYGLMYEGEMTILFADTGIGKSIFAFQMAVKIANDGRPVLYVDLELSDKQFQARYSVDYKNPFQFPDNLYFADISLDASIPAGTTYEDYFLNSLIDEIKRTGVKIVIIDNMTKIISTDTDKANTAKPLMDRLIDLKREHGLSLLLLEHTRKTDMFRPISINDLQGSKMKVNFADSVFSIGRSSQDVEMRYVKQLKCRSTEIVYHTENVAVYQVKKENSFLHFDFIEHGSEYAHLKIQDEDTLAERNAKIIDLKNKGLSNIEIGKQVGITEGAVRKVLKKSGNIQ